MNADSFPEVKSFRGFPAIDAPVLQTPGGTSYLRESGVVMVAKPDVNLEGMQTFLDGYDDQYKFGDYLRDPTQLPPAEALVKAAGQTCYASWGPGRSWNDKAGTYLDHIKDSGHGSVLEHANFSFMIYGISRSNSHEGVRHRAGTAFSQLSQRYVSGRVLRFVERPEYVDDDVLHADFEASIDEAAARYERRANRLYELQSSGLGILSDEQKTGLRKKVQQAARSGLPNETETVMFMTGNVRSWRHMIEMRANEAAEIEIRGTFFRVFTCLKAVAPMLFSDYETVQAQDGTRVVKTNWRKV